ncbi:MAG: beta-lactamase family protein [Gemmatimonadaceae bacterium]|nr:beta-lactamase family protein [Gemmatimonadaceae bacterium]
MRLISMLVLLNACAPAGPRSIAAPAPPAIRSDTALARRIDSVVTALLPARLIPGAAVAVIRHDTLVYAAGFGVASLATGAPVSAGTVFQIASLTKPFTAMAILMLVEEGKVALDDPAARYLSWLPAKYAQVTVRQLLTHSSGVNPDMRRENIDEFDVAEFRRRLEERPVSFSPGTNVQYANSGFTLLAFIVEAASGEEFGQYLKRRIFGPLGMKNAGYRVQRQADASHARGYELVSGRLVEAPHVFSGWGNSGIEASVLDIARFAAALERRALLRSATYDQMYTPARLANDSLPKFRSNGVSTQFGLSWFLTSYRGAELVSHGGAVAGFSSMLDRFVRDGWTIIVLSNAKQGADRLSQASAIARSIADLVGLRVSSNATANQVARLPE